MDLTSNFQALGFGSDKFHISLIPVKKLLLKTYNPKLYLHDCSFSENYFHPHTIR